MTEEKSGGGGNQEKLKEMSSHHVNLTLSEERGEKGWVEAS